MENAKRVCFAFFFASFNTHVRGNVKLSKKSYIPLIIYPHHPPGWNRYIYGSVLGLVGGIVAPLIGSILTVISWIVGPRWHNVGLHRAGTVLLVLGIPLLTIGAHCMDLGETASQFSKKHKGENGFMNDA